MIDNKELLKLATEVANKAHDTINSANKAHDTIHSDDVIDVIIVLCLAAVMLAKTYGIPDKSIRKLIDQILTETTATRQ